MVTKQTYSEEELAELIPDDVEEFFRFLVDGYDTKIMACIGKTSLDILEPGELADAYQKTLIAVWKKVQEPDFEPDRPLRMVFAIAKNKARDAVRKKLGRGKQKVISESDITDLVIADMESSDLRHDLQYADEEEKRRFYNELPDVIARLPERQKVAATAFLECYQEIREKDKYRPLAKAMSRITGQDETVDAAKSALRGAMANIRSEMIRRGISFLEGRN